MAPLTEPEVEFEFPESWTGCRVADLSKQRAGASCYIDVVGERESCFTVLGLKGTHGTAQLRLAPPLEEEALRRCAKSVRKVARNGSGNGP